VAAARRNRLDQSLAVEQRRNFVGLRAFFDDDLVRRAIKRRAALDQPIRRCLRTRRRREDRRGLNDIAGPTGKKAFSAPEKTKSAAVVEPTTVSNPTRMPVVAPIAMRWSERLKRKSAKRRRALIVSSRTAIFRFGLRRRPSAALKPNEFHGDMRHM
jgi:hypothetical protein